MNIGGPAPSLPLPRLRDDLQLLDGGVTWDGAPYWLLFDPLRNRFFRIGRRIFLVLSRWHLGSVERIVAEANAQTTASLNEQDVGKIIEFMFVNNLTVEPPDGDYRRYQSQNAARKVNWFKWLIHNYLFLRVPLLRPQSFLDATLPFVRFVYAAPFRWFLAILAFISLYLVERQWDEFLTTFDYFFSLEGLIGYAFAIAVVKIAHEFGHAYRAVNYGLKVPTMGVAFLVMWPVLFTDATDAWRLRNPKQRMRIAAAGMATELTIAILSSFVWAVAPEGALKSLAFFFATTSWISTVLINLNPFMRFDGYFLLADLWMVENLQTRAFAVAKWRLRELLFGLGVQPPGQFTRERRRMLVLYAWGTWIYRLVLFLGIALLVYTLFFKLMGIALFLVEIIWFILLPVANEMVAWWKMREQILKRFRSYITFAILGGLVVLAFVPWVSHLHVPAVLEYKTSTTIYPAVSARILENRLEDGLWVEKGDALVWLEAPDVDAERARLRERLDVVERRLDRGAVSDEERSQLRILLQEKASLDEAVHGLDAVARKLIIRAPWDGVVNSVTPGLLPGRWVSVTTPLAYVVDPSELSVHGMIDERDLNRLLDGAVGKFYPENPELAPLPIRFVRVHEAGIEQIDSPYFLSAFGGGIAASENADGDQIPESAIYRVEFDIETEARALLASAAYQRQAIRGNVRLNAKESSLVERLITTAASVLVRESGF